MDFSPQNYYFGSMPPRKPLRELIPTQTLETLTSGASRPEIYNKELQLYGFDGSFDAQNELRRRDGQAPLSPAVFVYDKRPDVEMQSYRISAEDESTIFKSSIHPPVGRKYRSEIYRTTNGSKSGVMIEKRIRDSKIFQTFGVSEDMKEAVGLLKPEVIQYMDDEFLSYLVAPSDNLNVPSEEKARLSIKHAKDKLRNKSDIRKYKFSFIVKDVINEDDRIDRLQEFSEKFSVEDVKNIFCGKSSEKKRKCLLLWLLNFNTNPSKSILYDYLKSR